MILEQEDVPFKKIKIVIKKERSPMNQELLKNPQKFDLIEKKQGKEN
jgi:hypothetical protein